MRDVDLRLPENVRLTASAKATAVKKPDTTYYAQPSEAGGADFSLPAAQDRLP